MADETVIQSEDTQAQEAEQPQEVVTDTPEAQTDSVADAPSEEAPAPEQPATPVVPISSPNPRDNAY